MKHLALISFNMLEARYTKYFFWMIVIVDYFELISCSTSEPLPSFSAFEQTGHIRSSHYLFSVLFVRNHLRMTHDISVRNTN